LQRNLEVLASTRFDLLIIGGGITGAGVALDATLRGYKVAVIDKGDFASGTSSVSSKLVHGGLRYLEHAEFHLVYEALHERGLLLRNAPHLVKPLRFVIPFYEGARVPPWKWRIGLLLYDLLAGRHNIQRSQPLARERLLRSLPALRQEGLSGGAAYFDAQMDDSRLCLEVVRAAMAEGARCVNYLEAVAIEASRSRGFRVAAQDRLHGQSLTIEARQVLNAAGPWGDQVLSLAGDASEPLLQPTKGVHIILPGQGLESALLLLHPDDGRVFFVIPWLGKTLIGTTDTEFSQNPDSLETTPEDISYLVRGYEHYFPAEAGAKTVLGSFVGLRPLLRARPSDPSSRSREFRVFTSSSGLITVAGGKYTTYRQMAETVTDRIAERLGRRRPCRTRNYRLTAVAGEDWPAFVDRTVEQLVRQYPLDAVAALHLIHRYGGRAVDVAALTVEHPGLARPIVDGEPDLRVELLYQREQEMAFTSEDHLLRRTRLGMFYPELLSVPVEQLLAD
jgi:glycerol-3-phosphate dehydrogenase